MQRRTQSKDRYARNDPPATGSFDTSGSGSKRVPHPRRPLLATGWEERGSLLVIDKAIRYEDGSKCIQAERRRSQSGDTETKRALRPVKRRRIRSAWTRNVRNRNVPSPKGDR